MKIDKMLLSLFVAVIALCLLALPTQADAAIVDSGNCGENLTWTLDDTGTLTISGTGDMGSWEEDYEFWSDVEDLIKVAIIKDGVTSIGDYAFSGCSSLTSVDIPDSITHIGFWAFYNCINLSNITIPKNVISIGDNAFYNCASLNGFWVDDANPNYSNDQYGVLFNKDKTKLMKAPQTLAGSYAIPDGVTTLGSYYELDCHPYDAAFSDCTKLTNITLPSSVTLIDEAAFADCNSLSEINIPDGIKEIRYIAFSNCNSLTAITIPDSVTYIGNYAFGGCTNLTYITLGKGIQEIYGGAFFQCDNLWHVLYTGTAGEWNNINSNPMFYEDWEENESLLLATRHYNCVGNEIIDLANKKCSICLTSCNHSFTSYISDNNATYDADGTKTATCDRDGCDATDTIPEPGTKLIRNRWFQIDGMWYYYKNDAKQTGWVLDGKTWYYMNSSGVMQTGWVQDGKTWYYMNTSGAMVTGWLQQGSTWYYLNSSGAMVTGWLQTGGTWYYFNSSGAMATGWLQTGGVWYYFKSSGAMVTGWQSIGGVWYYFQSGGNMVTGWLKQGGIWYYFKSSGAMATGSVKIGNKTYNFNSSGACLNP